MLELFRSARTLRIVANGLAFVGIVYAVICVLSFLRRDFYHALISFLILAVMVGLGLAARLKSANRSIPQWLRVGCFGLALFLFWLLFH